MRPEIGTVLYTSWGYDQTNVEYYRISEVSASGKSVRLTRIGTQVIDGRVYPDITEDIEEYPESWGPKKGWRDNTTTTWRKVKWDRDGMPYTNIDTIGYIRIGWTYLGGGRFDTIAAGYEGH